MRGKTLEIYFNSQQPSIVKRPVTGSKITCNHNRRKMMTANISKIKNLDSLD